MKDTTPLLEIRDVSMRFEFVEALRKSSLLSETTEQASQHW